MNTVDEKERYLQEAVKEELSGRSEFSEAHREARCHYWQSRTSSERIEATIEINTRVHLARGGKLEDLNMDTTFTRKGRIEDKNATKTLG